MRLNVIKPSPGSRPKATRVGRGIGSGKGKTCGRGHKGQKSRSNGFHKVGFEGGQTPIQRRVPKFGFNSWRARLTAEVRLSELEKFQGDVVDLYTLKVQGFIRHVDKFVKIIKSGELTKPLTIRGLRVTAGAKAVIERAGGTIEAISKSEVQSNNG